MSTQPIKIEFDRSVYKLANLPTEKLPEVAIIGRSNVGKSSFINRLARRKSLAKISSTPGRTQELNFFRATLKDQGQRSDCYLVDLPGFGYAKFSKKKREVLSAMIVEYLANRRELQIICLLNDCRRRPEKDELALRNLVFDNDKYLLVTLTKIDKIKKTAQRKVITGIAADYGLEPADLIISGNNLPTEDFWKRVLPLLHLTASS